MILFFGNSPIALSPHTPHTPYFISGFSNVSLNLAGRWGTHFDWIFAVVYNAQCPKFSLIYHLIAEWYVLSQNHAISGDIFRAGLQENVS
jgi:hypothetical protein